ncbi:MAG: LamG domain-containing protein [Pirellulales bacterium]|nr:LamG domain-containing protein [Pirellulales bacterium]
MRSRIHLTSAAMVLTITLLGGLLTGDVRAETVLVGHWTLDDGQADPGATTAVDSAVPPASNGDLLNFTGTSGWAAGLMGGALDFDGVNDRVDMGATAELDLTGDLSMAFWMKPSGATANNRYGPLVGKNQSGGPTNDAYFTDIVTGRSVSGDTNIPAGTIEFGITEGGVNTLLRSSSTLAVNEGDWRHIAVVFEAGSRMAIYIDGQLDAELTTGVPTACASTTYPFGLGNLGQGSSTDAYCYNGMLDDVRVYSGALTQAQIAAIIPEPTSLVLIIGGLVGLFIWRGRRRV